MRNSGSSAAQPGQAVDGGQRVTLELPLGSQRVPAILLTPQQEAPSAAALLLHGYSSRKEVMADSLGAALLRRGVASLAVDLPLHGTRADPLQLQSLRNPLQAAQSWQLALREAELATSYLRSLPQVDPRRVAVAGYSLGSFLAVMLSARDRQVSPVVLAAGGDLPAGTPLTAVARTVADPLRAIKKLGGRPLLMVSGRYDRTILPEQAERLFAAAPEPKELRWWDVGHTLPQAAIEDAAAWLAQQFGGQDG